MDNFSLPHNGTTFLPIIPYHSNLLLPLGRSLDPALQAFDDMLSSSFVLAVLNHDAPPHFALPKFHMYDGLQDPLDDLMRFRRIMTLQTSNDAFLYKVFSLSLAGPTLSWFHNLAPNTVTSFRCLTEKFFTQYMCSIRRKQSVINLFHVQMGRSESIRDFMKCFGVVILQLDIVILDIVLQAICPNTQFFDSLSLHPPTSIDELFQRGNQYAMLETRCNQANGRQQIKRYNRGKRKKSRDDKDQRGERNSKESRRSSQHSVP